MINFKQNLFMAASPQVVLEYIPFCVLIEVMLDDTVANDMNEGLTLSSNNIDIEENLTIEEITSALAGYKVWKEEQQKQSQSSRYGNQHEAYYELLIKKDHIKRDNNQPCNLHKKLPFYAPKPSHYKIYTFHLYKLR